MPSALVWLKRLLEQFRRVPPDLWLLLVVSAAFRLGVLSWWRAAPFGDVFNFVRIAVALPHGSYPLGEKRLPFYPLLILVGHTLVPFLRWETVAIVISLIASLVAIGLLYAIGRTLKLHRLALFTGVSMYAVLQPFVAYSIRGYADTTFIALLLGVILSILRVRTWRGSVLLGVLLGALMLTRYEGVAVAVVLLLVLAFRWWRKPRIIAATLGVAMIILLPYVLLASHTGRSLLPQAYLKAAAEAGSGYGAGSLPEFIERYFLLGRRLGLFMLWETPKGIVEVLRSDHFRISRHIVDLLREPRPAAALLAIPGFLLLFATARRRDLAVVALPFFAVAAAIAWYAPYVRYDAMIFPLMALAASAGIHVFQNIVRRARTPDGWGRALSLMAGVVLLFVLLFIWDLSLAADTVNSLRKSRFRDLASYRALHYVRAQPGLVAFAEYQAMREVYLGDRSLFLDQLTSLPKSGWDVLRKEQVEYAVVRLEPSPDKLAFVARPPPGVESAEVYRSSVLQGNGDRETVVVYRLLFSAPSDS